jgi:hypothetical protein
MTGFFPVMTDGQEGNPPPSDQRSTKLSAAIPCDFDGGFAAARQRCWRAVRPQLQGLHKSKEWGRNVDWGGESTRPGPDGSLSG